MIIADDGDAKDKDKKESGGVSIRSKEYEKTDELKQKLQDISRINGAPEEAGNQGTPQNTNNLFSNIKSHSRNHNRGRSIITSDILSLNEIRSTVDLKEELGSLVERPDARMFD